MARRSLLSLRSLALAAVVANVAIVLTGGVVRVTGSGLGCPDWPTCQGDRVLPAPGADAGWHTAIEFGNRLLSVVVVAVVVALFLVARKRSQDPRVRRLALGLVVGVLAQAVLGGITVLTELDPLVVAAHFLLSMVLLAIAVSLHAEVTGAAREQRAPDLVRRLALATVAVGAVVLVLGTLVTAAGPHAGDPGTPRLGVDIRALARLHAAAVWTVVTLTVATWFAARRRGSRDVQRAAAVLLAVEVVQGAVGYTQYAIGIPAGLVAIHILLASLFWVAAVRVALLAALGPHRQPSSSQEPVTVAG